MRVRAWLPAFAVCGLLAVAALLFLAVLDRRSNVVVVVIDTLRQDHLATYGYGRDTTPFLGSLARQGAVFDGLSPSSWTKPATASLLTGLHPVRHQAVGRWDRLSAEAQTLAELLRHNGYRTVGASANGWVSPNFGFDRGFDSFLSLENAGGLDLNRALLPRLERLTQPFFLYVHYIDSHLPYDPDIAWDGRPLPPDLRARGPVTVEEVDGPHVLERPPELLARARDLYDGEIRETDDALRDLVGQLASRGLMEDTVLVVTSDHGEELEEHGRMSHGQTLYQEVLRVPLVFYAPHRIPAGRRGIRASLLDIVPTLASLLDLRRLPMPPGQRRFDGESLAEQLASAHPAVPPVDRPFLVHLDFVDGTALALIRGRDKVVLGKNPYRKELFDLGHDPAERLNLLGRRGAAATFSRLGTEMADLYNGYARASLDRSTTAMDDAMAESLGALGYLGGRSPDRRPRGIPRRISPPRPSAGGRLGWEVSGALRSCLQMAQADSGRYLLEGWYDAGLDGRWSGRRGTLALGAPAGESRLALAGQNYRPSPVRLRVSVEHRLVLETEVAPGPFQLSARTAGVRFKDPTLVELETDTAFLPSQHGMADPRSLGLFLSSVCFEAAPADRTPAQPGP